MDSKQGERHKYWQVLVAEQEVSGRSIREFCQERNVTEHSFYWWRRHLREEKSVSFALVETKPAMAGVKFELALSSGEVLHIPADVESLRVVLEALRAVR